MNATLVRILVPFMLLIGLFILAGCGEEEPAVAADYRIGHGAVGSPERGRLTIPEYGCHACHNIPGVPQADSMVGPPLLKWSERRTIAGTLPNTPENLVRWIMNPQEVEPGTVMPDMGVSEEDARDIAAYLYTLGDDPLSFDIGVGGGDMAGDSMVGAGIFGSDVVDQPVPFSHQYHVGALGIDCRYCHQSVDESPFAGMPATDTCMTCHSQVWTNVPLLAPVRRSWETGEPIPWVRIYDLAEFTNFDHAIHLNSGVGCDHCHGRVDQMNVTEKAVSYTMEWCLECHREPERYLRPREEVYNLAWQPPENHLELGSELVEAYGIPVEILTDCSLCHY